MISTDFGQQLTVSVEITCTPLHHQLAWPVTMICLGLGLANGIGVDLLEFRKILQMKTENNNKITHLFSPSCVSSFPCV
jgi:hypothetical protein